MSNGIGEEKRGGDSKRKVQVLGKNLEKCWQQLEKNGRKSALDKQMKKGLRETDEETHKIGWGGGCCPARYQAYSSPTGGGGGGSLKLTDKGRGILRTAKGTKMKGQGTGEG